MSKGYKITGFKSKLACDATLSFGILVLEFSFIKMS